MPRKISDNKLANPISHVRAGKWVPLLIGIFSLCWGTFILATGRVGRLIYARDEAKYLIGGMLVLFSIWCFFWVVRYWKKTK